MRSGTGEVSRTLFSFLPFFPESVCGIEESLPVSRSFLSLDSSRFFSRVFLFEHSKRSSLSLALPVSLSVCLRVCSWGSSWGISPVPQSFNCLVL